MSPIPSPTPVRSKILRLIFSPAGLMFGFVALIIATCPGARGEDVIEQLIRNNGIQSRVASTTPAQAGVPGSSAADLDALIDRPTRSTGRAPVSSARSRTPAERAAAAAGIANNGTAGSFGRTRTVLPLLSSELEGDAAGVTARGLVPMTGPAVGIRPKLPGAGR